ncbi:MAG: STAS domain-containing protein [Phycisphaerae bacterium]
MPPTEHITVTKNDGVNVVEFNDRKILDELSITELGSQLREVAESESAVKILLNFQNVEHMSSAALGMLITLHKLVQDKQGRLKLSNIQPQIFEVFKITRLNKLFEIHDSAAQALGSF